jgi:hypothetical protein
MLFPVWFTYDHDGRAIFFAVPGGTWTGSTFSGDIYLTGGSAWLGVNYDPARFSARKVGALRLDFSDQSNAVMSYTFNGITRQSTITRQLF